MRAAAAGAGVWTLHPGTARIPAFVGPDLRARSFCVRADVSVLDGAPSGVLFSEGDHQSGQTLYVGSDRLVHIYRHAGCETMTRSRLLRFHDGDHQLELRVRRRGVGASVELGCDGEPVGRGHIEQLARTRIAYTGIDVGCDRGQPVGPYAAPFPFTGVLRRLHVVGAEDQALDLEGERRIEEATG